MATRWRFQCFSFEYTHIFFKSIFNTRVQLQLCVPTGPFGAAELFPALLSLSARLCLQQKSIPGVGVIGAAERPDQKQNPTGKPEPRRSCEERACKL